MALHATSNCTGVTARLSTSTIIVFALVISQLSESGASASVIECVPGASRLTTVAPLTAMVTGGGLSTMTWTVDGTSGPDVVVVTMTPVVSHSTRKLASAIPPATTV